MVIVDNGRPKAVLILWNPDASPVAAFAAYELQAYIQRMSGVQLLVLMGTAADASVARRLPSAVIVASRGLPAGRPPAGTRSHRYQIPPQWLAPTVELLANAREDSFAIATIEPTDAATVVLAGVNHRATLYAVYAFLENLGVRFTAPGFGFYEGNFEYVPSMASVEAPTLQLHESPDFRFRRKYVEEGWSHTPTNLVHLVDWMAKKRLNVLVYPYDYQGRGLVKWDTCRELLIPELTRRGIAVQVGGHGYQSFLPKARYEAAHPDWFPDPSESAVGQGSGAANVFRVTDESALQTYVSNVISYLRKRPEIEIFDAWPPDGARWSKQDVDRLGGIANANAYVTNRLNAAVRVVLPHVRIENISYVPATEPPAPDYMYDESIIIDFAPITRSYGAPLPRPGQHNNEYYDNLIRRWLAQGYRGQLGIYEYYRKYAWHSLPVVLPRLIAEDMAHYQSLGMNGFGIYSEPADWITYELTHLLVADMSWDSRLDIDGYLETYLRERYGTVAAEMSAYLDLVEEAGRKLFHHPTGSYQELDRVAHALESYRQADGILRSAAERAGGSAAAFLIKRLRSNLEFAIADTELSYYQLLGNGTAAERATRRARRLVEKYRLDGIILHSTRIERRYGQSDTPDRKSLYALYHS